MRSKHDNPSDPCLVFAKQCDAFTNTNVDTSTLDTSCPRYHPAVLDGRVCLRCFRDDYEIEHWDSLSFAEKAYALEDASDRAQAMEAEASDDNKPNFLVGDLKRQALLWRSLGENEPALEASHPGTDGLSNNVDNTDLDQDANGKFPDIQGDNCQSTFVIPSVVTISTNMPTKSKTSTSIVAKAETVEELKTNGDERTKESQKNELQGRQRDAEHHRDKDREQSPPPPTPCTRICRYNADCYDGKVCIGCFRDTHDIAQWSSMSAAEKMFSLEDAADRCKNLSERGKGTDTCYEGGITEAALRDQATRWGAWKG